MRLLLLLVIGLAVGGAMLYFFVDQQQNVQENALNMQKAAQEKTDAYKQQQADMMKQLGQ
jgi:uncharacterized protein HemX